MSKQNKTKNVDTLAVLIIARADLQPMAVRRVGFSCTELFIWISQALSYVACLNALHEQYKLYLAVVNGSLVNSDLLQVMH